jgi:hypothetical protein
MKSWLGHVRDASGCRAHGRLPGGPVRNKAGTSARLLDDTTSNSANSSVGLSW